MESVKNVRGSSMKRKQNKPKKAICFLSILVSIFMLSGCGLIHHNEMNKIKVITTLYPQYEFVKALIGDDKQLNQIYEVSLIVPPGVDCHTFDPRLSDLIEIKNSNLFIYTSDVLETWVSKLNVQKYTEVLDLSSDPRIVQFKMEEHDEEDAEHEEHHQGHAHEYDPHYWVYPIYAKYMVEEIRDKLVEITPDGYGNREKIKIHAEAYIQELEKIDRDIQKITQNAKNKTTYFASPFSFFYWSYYYGLEYVLTYSTCSTEIEPSIKTIIEVINAVKENQVQAIFIKELLNSRVANMISEYTGAEVLLLHSCHNISKEDFNNPMISYIYLMQQNVKNLAKGLNVDTSELNLEIERGGYKLWP